MRAAQAALRPLRGSARVCAEHSTSSSQARVASPAPSTSMLLLDDFEPSSVPKILRRTIYHKQLGTDNLFKTLSCLPSDGIGRSVRAIRVVEEPSSETLPVHSGQDGPSTRKKHQIRVETIDATSLPGTRNGGSQSRESWKITRVKLIPSGNHGTAWGIRHLDGMYKKAQL